LPDSADVEYTAGGVGQQVEHWCVYLLERESLVLGHQIARADVVSGHDIADLELGSRVFRLKLALAGDHVCSAPRLGCIGRGPTPRDIPIFPME